MGIKTNVVEMADHVWELYGNISDYGSMELENEVEKIAILLDYISKGFSYKKAIETYEGER